VLRDPHLGRLMRTLLLDDDAISATTGNTSSSTFAHSCASRNILKCSRIGPCTDAFHVMYAYPSYDQSIAARLDQPTDLNLCANVSRSALVGITKLHPSVAANFKMSSCMNGQLPTNTGWGGRPESNANWQHQTIQVGKFRIYKS
jgi:hypothetical protein